MRDAHPIEEGDGRMADVLEHAVAGAIADVLGDNDAVPLEHISIVRYMRTSPDGSETYDAWAVLSGPTLTPFAHVGLARLVSLDGERRLESMLAPFEEQ